MTRVAVDDALDAEAFEVGEALDAGSGPSSVAGGGGDGLGDRVLGGVLERAGEAQHLVAVDAVGDPTSTSAMRPVVTVPVLSSTTVSIWRVDSRTCGPLMRMPSWAPRPVPTSSAVGVARPRAQGQAMISTATAAVNAVGGLAGAEPEPEGADGEGDDDGDEHGGDLVGEPLDRGLAVLGVGDEPGDLGQRGVGADPGGPHDEAAAGVDGGAGDRVAGPTSTGTGSPVSSEASMAEVPSSTMPSVATFSPGRTTNRSPTASCSIGMRTSVPSREDGDVLGAQVEQRPQGGAGAALGAGFEVAAGEDERRDDGGHLEVELVCAGAAFEGEVKPIVMPGMPASPQNRA